MFMRSSWAQPSLSRDFALLSAVILFVLVLISGWITYRTYEKHSERIAIEMEKEAFRIEQMLATELSNANYMLSSLGRQIIIDPNRDYTKLAQSLKSFDSKGHIYSILSWTNPDKKLVVSSNKGVLEEPVDISDRDFVQQAATDSWRMHIGKPIEGRVSGKWVIPVAMGITDYTGKFIGIISLSIDIGILTEEIRNLVKRDGISFAIVSKSLVPLTEVSDIKNFISDNFPTQKLTNIDFEKEPAGLISKAGIIRGEGIYAYYRASESYPYVILIGYDANFSDETVRTMLWSRLLQILMVAVFFVFFLWIVRVRVIKPVLDMTGVIASIVKGEKFTLPPKNGPVEIEGLAVQVQQVSRYIDETKRIENELRNKMFLLKKAKENAEINLRSKSEFLAYIAQEVRMPVNNIIGSAQVLKDQVYGSIENRKYRQYAADIFMIANQLIAKIQDILLHSKAENGYMGLQEKSLDVATLANASLRQITDRLHICNASVKVNIQEPMPRLFADEFRLQQVIINLLLVLLEDMAGRKEIVITLESKIVSEHRDRQFFVLSVTSSGADVLTREKMALLAEDLVVTILHSNSGSAAGVVNENIDLRLELVRTLVGLHGGILHVDSESETHSYIILLPASRLLFQEEP
jgi:signal transduction histidine kinase